MTYYRPQWTCGRYDKHANVALYYNLIEGISYFFEDYSALVIGTILSIGRNTSITVEELSKQTDIAIDSLTPFLEELKDLHLLAIKQVTTALNPQLHSRSATYIKRNGLLIRKITIKSSRPFQCAYHPLTP